jgi:hypothetical protein
MLFVAYGVPQSLLLLGFDPVLFLARTMAHEVRLFYGAFTAFRAIEIQFVGPR